jgi:hypothetical protein
MLDPGTGNLQGEAIETNDMKRRHFLAQTIATAAATSLSLKTLQAAESKGKPGNRQFYELRRYHLKDELRNIEAYFKKALVPALNRAAIQPIGAFKELDSKEGTMVWLLIPMNAAEDVTRTAQVLAADSEFKTAGADWLGAEKGSPAFERIDSWLHIAFTGMTTLAVPELTKANQPRVFELRTYESHSEVKALKKIEMFNSGEIEVMREVKLRPVFYGQALVGRDLPHLTYMLCGENVEEHKKHFAAFGRHPVWTKLKNDPAYADTVSKITSRFLEPLDCSQI